MKDHVTQYGRDATYILAVLGVRRGVLCWVGGGHGGRVVIARCARTSAEKVYQQRYLKSDRAILGRTGRTSLQQLRGLR